MALISRMKEGGGAIKEFERELRGATEELLSGGVRE
jgi:hypothetical protein